MQWNAMDNVYFDGTLWADAWHSTRILQTSENVDRLIILFHSHLFAVRLVNALGGTFCDGCCTRTEETLSKIINWPLWLLL